MKLNRVRERFREGDTFTLYPLGDIHLGSANCDRALLREVVSEIEADPMARWLGMGDYGEFITPRDPRWAAKGIDRSVVDIMEADEIGDVLVNTLAGIFRPIIGQCWGMGRGNHELAYERHAETNVLGRLLKALGRPELDCGWAALTKVQVEANWGKRNALTIYHAHGWQAGRMSGARINEAKRMAASFDADIYLHGHSHDLWILPLVRLRASHCHKRLIADRKWAGQTGCFLLTYKEGTEGYGERAEYPPTVPGVLRIRLHPTRRGFEVSALQ